MTELSLIHHTFSVERRYQAPVEDVFAAWSDPRAKRRWFAGGDGEHALDFQVGGTEISRNRGANGKLLEFESRYTDIVDGRRIVYTSTLSADGHLATTSVTTVEFNTDNNDTILLLTESDVFLDGQEQPSWRERGTGDWLTSLGSEFEAAVR